MIRRRQLVAAAGAAGLLLLSFSTAGRGSTPSTQSIDGSRAVTWSFAPAGGPTFASDSHTLTVKLPQAAAKFYAPDRVHGTTHAAVLTVVIKYTPPSPLDALGLSATDPQGNSVGAATLETEAADPGYVDLFVMNPVDGKYTITVSASAGATPQAVPSTAVATLRFTDLRKVIEPANPGDAPVFANYDLPQGLMPETAEERVVLQHRAFGEPSIGVDPKTDAAFYQAGLYVLKGTFDQSHPAKASWVNVTYPTTDKVTEDAIDYVDRVTGRVFVSQLDVACSISAYSDDDGKTWTPALKPCQTPAGPDHQTIGSGVWVGGTPVGATYPRAVYYCSQSVAFASCATSLDGGFTYGVAHVMWNLDQCFGLHGHIKTAPDGTAYVPDKMCGAPECEIVTSTTTDNCHRGLAVSRDNGKTWSIHVIPDSHARLIANGDPGVAVGSKGTVYYAYDDRDGHPKVAVSHDHGSHWTKSVDVSDGFPIQNTQMPVVVAGDDDRAAFSFLGTDYPGDDQDGDFLGAWHLYVSFTYDGGRTWHTQDALNGKPVQRGCIEFSSTCPSGGTAPADCSGPPGQECPNQRNLLDFNDITIDREGRVLVAYTDGCAGRCLTDPTYLSGNFPGGIRNPAVIREDCGRGLYAAYDAMTTCSAAVTKPVEVTPSPKRPGLATTGGNLVWAFGGVLAAALLLGVRRVRRRF